MRSLMINPVHLPPALPFHASAFTALLLLLATLTTAFGQTAPATTPISATASPATGAPAPAVQGGRGPAIPMTDEIRAELTQGTAELVAQIAALKKQYSGQKKYDRIADVEIFLNAVKF